MLWLLFKIFEHESLYEAQIEIISDGISEKEVQGEKKGACSADPSK